MEQFNCMENEKIINYRFKILYAVGIILVVVGHTSPISISIFNDWFPYYNVHLPLFCFCSGYFYKKKSEENIFEYIIKKTQRLIIPLYVYNIFYGIIVQIMKIKHFEIGGDFNLYNIFIAPIMHGHQFLFNLGGWFIVPLFMVEILNVLIRKTFSYIKRGISEHIYFLFNLLLGIFGNYLAYKGFNYGFWLVLVRMLHLLPFYALGIYYKNNLEKYDAKISHFWYFVFVFSLKLLVIYYYGRTAEYSQAWCDDFIDGPIAPVIVGYLGIAFWLRIACILEPVIGKSKFINTMADNTYSIMMNHLLGSMIVKTIFAIISKFYIGFSDFDWVGYKTDIWYYYMPKGIYQTLIIYVVFGTIFSIMVQKVINNTKQALKTKLDFLNKKNYL